MAGWGRFEEAEARNQELETGREKGRRGGGVAAFLRQRLETRSWKLEEKRGEEGAALPPS